MTMCAITHLEITAWSKGMQIELHPFERKMIREVDSAYLIHCSKKEKAKR